MSEENKCEYPCAECGREKPCMQQSKYKRCLKWRRWFRQNWKQIQKKFGVNVSFRHKKKEGDDK